MASLNLCQFIGNVGADPEIRTFENGNRIAVTRIAVTERFLDRNNQQQERTEWVGLVFNGKTVDVVEQYVHKGSSIYVSGKWHNREWQDQSGNKRQSTELSVNVIQLLDKRPQQTAPAQPTYQQPAPPAQGYQAPPAPAPRQAAPPQYQAPAQPQYQQPAPPPQYAPAQGYPPQPAYQPQNEGPDLPF